MIRFLKKIKNRLSSGYFTNTVSYWEDRYASGGNSGSGSYGENAKYKAEFLNNLFDENNICSVIEFGCGDGHQLSLANYKSYIGLDVSSTAIQLCIDKFQKDQSKSFYLYNSNAFADNHQLFKADASISLDVIFHLVENNLFENYMRNLFSAADKMVVIYAYSLNEYKSPHVLHRDFNKWVVNNIKGWKLHSVNGNKPKPQNVCDFYVYTRI